MDVAYCNCKSVKNNAQCSHYGIVFANCSKEASRCTKWLRVILYSKVLVFIQSAWCHPLTGTSVMLSHSAVKGVRFLSFFCLTASFDREFLSPEVQQKKQWLWRLLFMTVFLSPELSFTSGRIVGGREGLNNPLQCGRAVRLDAAHPHQSLLLMVNRRQLLSLIVVGWSGQGKTLTSCIFFQVQHSISLCHEAAHRFKRTLRWCYTPRSVNLWQSVQLSPWKLLCNVFCDSDESFGWMSSGLFIYLRTSAFSRQGGSDNDVSDWVTLESNVFKLYPPWGIQVGVIQVHSILI